ncbi:MAG: hypothetical protein RL701_5061 [Pseudomonadota bacterium]
MAWVGMADMKAGDGAPGAGLGPIAAAVEARGFDKVALLTDFDDERTAPYTKWLRSRTKTPVTLTREKLKSPTDHGGIHEAAVRHVQRLLGDNARGVALTFHLSSGTPAMAAIWLLLGKTRFPAELIESSKESGVRTVEVPFDIAVDFIPDLLRERDEKLREGSAAEAPPTAEFADIIHRSRIMERLLQRARRVALRNVPVLIEGESGTGKEMLAKVIHGGSPRRQHEMIAVNCGAIPAELIESFLFGHEKGAFTDAKQARQGYFEAAHGSTLFLDELGELPALAQVKLLRVLQQGEVVRVGATRPIQVDVRVIAATNRSLTEEISAGRFREDLFYRLAVAVLNIPPLRERSGDLGPLLDHLMQQVNGEGEAEPGYKEKKLSAGAKNLIQGHSWPGNVRELHNTLRRAALWSEGTTISAEDMREALLPTAASTRRDLLDQPLGNGFNIQELLDKVRGHYLRRALTEAQGNKTKAAELVGLPSYQTFSNWLAKDEAHG